MGWKDLRMGRGIDRVDDSKESVESIESIESIESAQNHEGSPVSWVALELLRLELVRPCGLEWQT